MSFVESSACKALQYHSVTQVIDKVKEDSFKRDGKPFYHILFDSMKQLASLLDAHAPAGSTH